jgi:hypothetical protein
MNDDPHAHAAAYANSRGCAALVVTNLIQIKAVGDDVANRRLRWWQAMSNLFPIHE